MKVYPSLAALAILAASLGLIYRSPDVVGLTILAVFIAVLYREALQS